MITDTLRINCGRLCAFHVEGERCTPRFRFRRPRRRGTEKVSDAFDTLYTRVCHERLCRRATTPQIVSRCPEWPVRDLDR